MNNLTPFDATSALTSAVGLSPTPGGPNADQLSALTANALAAPLGVYNTVLGYNTAVAAYNRNVINHTDWVNSLAADQATLNATNNRV